LSKDMQKSRRERKLSGSGQLDKRDLSRETGPEEELSNLENNRPL